MSIIIIVIIIIIIIIMLLIFGEINSVHTTEIMSSILAEFFTFSFARWEY